MTLLETDDLQKWSKEYDRTVEKYEDLFSTVEQAEYFVMLPLTEKQRQEILQVLSKEKKEKNVTKE